MIVTEVFCSGNISVGLLDITPLAGLRIEEQEFADHRTMSFEDAVADNAVWRRILAIILGSDAAVCADGDAG